VRTRKREKKEGRRWLNKDYKGKRNKKRSTEKFNTRHSDVKKTWPGEKRMEQIWALPLAVGKEGVPVIRGRLTS
jgi:hypothetical protein